MGRVIAGAAMVVLAGTLAYGQAGGQTGGEGGIRVGGQETPPLAGPSAGDAIAKPTLVERAYDGTLKRLELPPAEAAVALLELDDAARVRVEALIAERAAAVDEVVIGNIELLVSVKGAGESGDRVRAIGLLRKLDEAFGGIEPVRKFEERLGGAMGLVQRQEFMALLDEYRDAVAEDRRRALEREGAARRELRPRALRLRERLEELGVEIRRSYERQVTLAAREFEALMAKLALRPEQEGEIRRLVADYAQRTQLNPNEADRRAIFLKVLSHLDEDQRRILFESARGR